MTSTSIINCILRYPINPNRRVPEACVCPRRPSDTRAIFEGCIERFAWFAPKSEGCLEQNAFRKSLFFQKRGMSRAKRPFPKPILTLNGKRGKNKKKMRHCDRLECYLYFMHQMRNVFAAVCGCLQLSVAVCSCLWLSVAVCD